MDINQLSEIVKKKIKKGIEVQKINIDDKTYLHLNHAGHDIKKFHIKVSIESNYLNKMDRIKRSKIVYNLIDNELKNYIHSIQLDII